MTTPPRPTREDYDTALNRVHARRRRAGDDHPLALSEDPREVLVYLRQRGRNGLIADATGDDISDALTLRLWIWWEGEDTELWLLEAAEALDRNRKTIGSVLGIRSGQGLVDRIGRLRHRLGRHQDPPRPPAATTADTAIRELAAELVARAEEMPDEVADDLYLDKLRDELATWPPGAPPPTEGVLNTLRFLLGDLADETGPDSSLRPLIDRGAALVGVRRSQAGSAVTPGK